MSLKSSFDYSCLNNSRKDSLGFHFYLLVKKLASLQNEFLAEIKNEMNKSKNSTRLTEATTIIDL